MTSFSEIEDMLEKLGFAKDKKNLVEAFLKAYGVSSATIARAGITEKSLSDGVAVAKKVYVKSADDAGLDTALQIAIDNNFKKTNARLVMLIGETAFTAYDTVTEEMIFARKENLHKHADFFLPIAGREKSSVSQEERLDGRIAERLTRLYNLIGLSNEGVSGQYVLEFLLSLVMLFVLNDYKVITLKRKLPEYLDLYTDEEGTELFPLIEKLKAAVNGSQRDAEIRYIDSRLFSKRIPNLHITKEIRSEIIKLAGMHWLDLKIDNLGQLLQSIAVDRKTSLSNNYTTTENVHRVIDPLFMDEINSKIFDVTCDKEKALELQKMIQSISVLDPACASGSFLAVAWMSLNQSYQILNQQVGGQGLFPVDHIYGIDTNNNALYVTRISLFFAVLSSKTENCNLEMSAIDALFSQKIIKENGLLVDWWAAFEPIGKMYIIGTPPMIGARKQLDSEREAFKKVFSGIKKCGDVDYAGAFFLKSAKFINEHSGEMAFVTTNSLTQGTQVVQLWKVLFSYNVRIRFAYQAFKWSNDAKNKTAVTVVIVNLTSNEDYRACSLYTFAGKSKPVRKLVRAISPYLVEGYNMVEEEKRGPISISLPKMVKGNMPYNTEELLLSPEEKSEIAEFYPESEKFFKRVVGSSELIKGTERWCLWIHEQDVKEALSIPPIKKRLDKVKADRLRNKDRSVVKKAERYWEFREINETHTQSVVVPAVSSENYAVVPAELIGPETIVTNLSFVVYDCDYWILGLILSKMHNVWIRHVCGGLETRVRYSETLGYNTFPFPNISETHKQEIRDCVEDLIASREANYGLSLQKMYKEGCMPMNLQQAHLRLDRVVDRCYREEPFTDDQERIYLLFEMYEKMQGGI